MPAIKTTTFTIPTSRTEAKEYDSILIQGYAETVTDPATRVLLSYYKNDEWTSIAAGCDISSTVFANGTCTIKISSRSGVFYKATYIPAPD